MLCCGGKCWCSYRDPIAYLAVPMAWAQILFVTYCMTFQMVIPVVESKLAVALILISFYVLFILIVWSYVKSMFSDPGVVDRDILKRISAVDPKASTYRRKCNDLKPYRSHHCSRCQGCIMKMDHHCPWISNCVGMRNQKYFMLFLLYVAIDETLAFIMTIRFVNARMDKFQMYWHMIPLYYMFDWVRNHPKWALFFEKWHIRFPFFESELLMEVVVCIQGLFSFIFVVFCIILFYDQLKNIWYDKTYIEQVQEGTDDSHAGSSFYRAACEAMGEPFCLRWFLPVEGKDMEREFAECCHLMIPEVEEDEEHEKVE